MRTRDTEYLYATTRIRSLERTLLNEERKGRMLEAQSFEDLVKMLSELGYGDMQNATPHDVERALAREREATFRLLDRAAQDRREHAILHLLKCCADRLRAIAPRIDQKRLRVCSRGVAL